MTPPPSATVLEIASPNIEQRRLANGIELVVSEAGSELADVRLVWRVGRADAPPDQGGAPLLAARMLFNDERLAAMMRQLGAADGYESDRDGVWFGATVLATDVDAFLGALARVVREPRCDDERLARVKDMQVRLLRNSAPATLAIHVLSASMYEKGHAYAPVDAAELGRVTCAAIVALRKDVLVPERLSIVVAGGVRIGTVERSARGYFESIAGSAPVRTASTSMSSRSVSVIDKRDTDQVVIAIGRLIPRSNEDDAFKLAVLQRVVGIARAKLRHWDEIAYGLHINVDELARGYELQVVTTVPKARAAEALVAITDTMRDSSSIIAYNARMLYPDRVSMLQSQMLRYQTVSGITREIAGAVVKGRRYDTTIAELYALRDSDWGQALLWANARTEVTNMSVVLVGDKATAENALRDARL